mgnify:CR=1 FL=1
MIPMMKIKLNRFMVEFFFVEREKTNLKLINLIEWVWVCVCIKTNPDDNDDSVLEFRNE